MADDVMTDDPQDWYSNDAATFGDRLADARQAMGMTQGQLAQRLGVKLKTLQNWENDLSEPRANRLSMLSGLLNVSFRWLLTGEGEGLSGPPEEAELPTDMAAMLTELRQMQGDMMRLAGAMGKLEKRLKKAMIGAGA